MFFMVVKYCLFNWFLWICLCSVISVECFLVSSKIFDVLWLRWCINFRNFVFGCDWCNCLIILNVILELLWMVILVGLLIINRCVFLWRILNLVVGIVCGVLVCWVIWSGGMWIRLLSFRWYFVLIWFLLMCILLECRMW